MIVEIGHYALVLAFGLALVQGTLPLWGAARGDAGLIALARSTALGQFVFDLHHSRVLTPAPWLHRP